MWHIVVATLLAAGAGLRLVHCEPTGALVQRRPRCVRAALESGMPAPATCKVATAAHCLHPEPSGPMRHPCCALVSGMRWQRKPSLVGVGGGGGRGD